MTLRHCEIVIGADLITADTIQKTINTYSTIKKYAYINHDKDKDEKGNLKKAHWHIYIWFGYPVDISMISKWFNIPPNFIEKVKGGRDNLIKYLIHRNASNKHQYMIEEVITNIDINSIINKINIFERYGDFDNYSYAEHIQHIKEILNNSDRLQAYDILKKNWSLHCDYLATKGNRNMKVIFIEGPTGCGKTTFAKMMADNLKKDYCISSSNNDILQDYKGQKILILDDVRDSALPFNDFLKLLDNHTSSSVKARYYNKIFNGDIIIITSTIPLTNFYKGIKEEDKKQIYRRISEYVLMDFDDVQTTEIINTTTGVPMFQLNKLKFPNPIPALLSKEPINIISYASKFLGELAKDDELMKKISQLKIDNDKLPF